MCSRFERLRASEESVTLSSTLEMKKLLGIVNEIIGVESYPDDDQLPSFEDQLPSFESRPVVDLACASCGGEVFQVAFDCKSTCLRDDETGTSSGNKGVICPLCFVEGRTCSCGEMQPVRVREIGPLVETRDMAHGFIRGLAEKFLLPEDESNSANTHSIFMAASILHQRRSLSQASQSYPLVGRALN